MKFGLAFANTMEFVDPSNAAALGRNAEAAGFDSIWTVEHVIYPDGYESPYPYDESGKMPAKADTPIPDPLIWLTWVGAATTSLRLGTGILILPQRNPLVLAKEVATLHALTGGRLELGIGVGWLREEFDALGVSWPRRGVRTDEYVEAMRALWAGDHADFAGEFVEFANVSSNPKPPGGGVPIIVGGHTEAAARRAGRLGDGFFPGSGSAEALAALIEVVRSTASDNGRDPAAIEMTLPMPPNLLTDPGAAIAEMAEIGADRLIVPAFFFMGDGGPDAMANFGQNIIGATS